MSKFLGVSISDHEQLIIQNEVIPKITHFTDKIVPAQADILHALIAGYDAEKAETALKLNNDISETEMYSMIKKSIGQKVSDDIRSLVAELKSRHKWTNQMIAFVFVHCAEKGKGFVNYTSKVARAWAEEGVKTYGDMLKKTAPKKK